MWSIFFYSKIKPTLRSHPLIATVLETPDCSDFFQMVLDPTVISNGFISTQTKFADTVPVVLSSMLFLYHEHRHSLNVSACLSH